MIFLYTPGHHLEQKFYNDFEKSSAKPALADIDFQVVHCRKHLSFCTQKYDGAKSQPVTEMYHLNDAG